MKIIYGMITCNRPEYFKQNIDTLLGTFNSEYDWHVIIADDSSIPNYTFDYVTKLEAMDIRVTLIKTIRRGPHYLVNRILQAASREEFDYGFMAEDDIYFIQKGWDDGYVTAIQKSSLDYLCYFNSNWAKKHGRAGCVKKVIVIPDKLIQSEVKIFSCFGCFWTFTPRIIKDIGYFDMNNFGVWGNAHTDYAKRCCRLNYNGINGHIFDLLDSQEFIQMQSIDYRSSGVIPNVDCGLVGVPDGRHKGLFLNKATRNYVPYNEINFNMAGEVLK